MVGDVLQLRRAEELLEAHPTASHHGTDLYSFRVVNRNPALERLDEGGEPYQDDHSDVLARQSPCGRSDYMTSLSIKAGLHFKDIVAISKRKTDDGDIYMTELREPLSQSPLDRTYFARFDVQLTKVNKFYKKKETENIARAGVPERKMLELINAQEAVARQGIPGYAMPSGYLNEDEGGHMTGVHVQNPKELSGELPLMSEDTERSKSFLVVQASASGKHQGDIDEDGEIDDEEFENGKCRKS